MLPHIYSGGQQHHIQVVEIAWSARQILLRLIVMVTEPCVLCASNVVTSPFKKPSVSESTIGISAKPVKVTLLKNCARTIRDQVTQSGSEYQELIHDAPRILQMRSTCALDDNVNRQDLNYCSMTGIFWI